MAVTVFPRTGRVWAPLGRLNRGHWAAQGLRLCVLGGQGNGPAVSYPRFVGGVGVAGAVGNLRWGPFGMRFTSEVDGVRYSLASVQAPSQRITVVFVRQKADTTARSGICFSNNTATAGERVRIHCPFSDGTVYWDFGGSSSPNRLSQGGLTFTTMRETWAFVAGARGSSIWRNGLLVTSQSTAITSTASTADFFINGGGIGDGDIQDIEFLAMLDSEWTAGQVWEWHTNPYLMFSGRSLLPQTITTAGGTRVAFLG